MMKKIAFYFCSFLMVFVFACSNDANNSEETSETPETPQNPTQLFPANFQATGSSANDILSNTNFDRLLIEIAYVEGFRPTTNAISAFTTFIREFSFKQFIELRFTELESPNDEDNEFTIEEISDLEIANRTAYNDENTLAIYIFFADEPNEGDDLDEGLVTLGAVYRNTSMVIFESTIRVLSSRFNSVTLSDIEEATLEHEFGHLFGLVNLGTVAINDHEDPEAENHCIIDPCLMRGELVFQVPGSEVFKSQNAKTASACNLNGMDLMRQMESRVARSLAAVPELDDECQLDLAGNGGRSALDN